MPTFEWERRPAGERAYISRRSGGGLRVYLKGPWYTSGYGEMLAVVLAVDGTSSADMDGPLKRFVTRWGRDPIWDTSQPPDNPALPPPVLRQIPSPAPSLEQFRLALTHGPIDPQLLPDGVPPSEAELPGGGFRVSDLEAPGLGADGAVVFDVAPHAVGWDAARALWFCDIVIDPGEAYFPFVQLALARYQPTSLDGAHLSTIRQPEVVQLVPDRLVVARRGVPSQPDRVTVNVFGRAARNFGGERITTSAVPGQPTVVVRVEARDRGTVGDLGWEPVPGAAFAPVLESGAPMPFIEDLVESDVPPDLWSGVFTLQEMQEAREHRIMLREYEQQQVDPENESDDEPEANPAYRLVYAEAVLLDDVPT